MLGMRSLRSPRHRWEYSIKIYFKEIGCVNMDWAYLSWDRGGLWQAVVNAVMNF